MEEAFSTKIKTHPQWVVIHSSISWLVDDGTSEGKKGTSLFFLFFFFSPLLLMTFFSFFLFFKRNLWGQIYESSEQFW